MNEKISDQKIVRHYLDRLESAILETKNKYGKLIILLRTISFAVKMMQMNVKTIHI